MALKRLWKLMWKVMSLGVHGRFIDKDLRDENRHSSDERSEIVDLHNYI